MFGNHRSAMLVAAAVFSTLSLVGGGAESTAIPAGNATVLVEAFVVKVNLAALAETGVSPIAEAPHAVSVENILTCLGTGQACVVAGAKAASQHEGRGTVRANRTIYVTRETSDPRRAIAAPYQSTDKFEVSATVRTSDTVRVEFSYASSMFLQDPQETDGPPNLASWEWAGAIVLAPGEPEIAAATQDEQGAVFLLLTTRIQGE